MRKKNQTDTSRVVEKIKYNHTLIIMQYGSMVSTREAVVQPSSSSSGVYSSFPPPKRYRPFTPKTKKVRFPFSPNDGVAGETLGNHDWTIKILIVRKKKKKKQCQSRRRFDMKPKLIEQKTDYFPSNSIICYLR